MNQQFVSVEIRRNRANEVTSAKVRISFVNISTSLWKVLSGVDSLKVRSYYGALLRHRLMLNDQGMTIVIGQHQIKKFVESKMGTMPKKNTKYLRGALMSYSHEILMHSLWNVRKKAVQEELLELITLRNFQSNRVMYNKMIEKDASVFRDFERINKGAQETLDLLLETLSTISKALVKKGTRLMKSDPQ